MPKISISSVFKRQKRVRILTTLCMALIVVVFSQMMISNPGQSFGASGPGDVDGDGQTDDYIIDTSANLISRTDGIYLGVYAAGTAILPNDNTRSLKITNGATVTLWAYGRLNVKTLIIEQNATLTHKELDIDTTPDFNTTTGVLTATGVPKYVNVFASDSLKLESGGKINVNGKGYPGGDAGKVDGYGPGGGGWRYSSGIDGAITGGGGGSYGGLGGRGTDCHESHLGECVPSGAVSGVTYGDAAAPVSHGSGGGSAVARGRFSPGAPGGGRVKIITNKMYIDETSSISANGNDYIPSEWARQKGGPGSGGSIWINAQTIYARQDSTLGLPSVAPGAKAAYAEVGRAGSLNLSSVITNSLHQITANGGNAEVNTSFDEGKTGSGGGGRISISATALRQICRITSSDAINYIPASCENQDVVLDGAITIYADHQRIWSGQDVSCDDQNDADCVSDRHFANLTIKNGAVLTHDPIILADMAEDDAGHGGTSGDHSLADNTTGSARWKKIDIEVVGDLILESGGKINADGLGYPGGRVLDCTVDSTVIGELTNGEGPAAGTKGFNGNTYRTIFGGGGGLEGNGGDGNDGGIGGIYPTAMKTNSSLQFEFGSGGGSAYSHDFSGGPFDGGNDWACSDGGAGGGRIRLTAENIKIFSATSTISANGGTSTVNNNDNEAYGGGGSGGTIILMANSLIFGDPPSLVASTVDAGSTNAGVGLISNNFDSNVTFNFFANAGSGHNASLAGGGGGRIIIGKMADARVTVQKKLIAYSRPGILPLDDFNPYALRKDDTITVELTIGAFPKTIDVRDDFLTIPGTAICDYVDGTASPTGAIDNGTYIVWTGINSRAGTTVLSYNCKVR